MASNFQLKPGESILFRTQPLRKWYVLVGKIGLELLEVAIFILFSFTALTSLSGAILGTFLPPGVSEIISRVIFQYIVPILMATWLLEETARNFNSELVLTSQRVWTKGSPYAWTPERETPLSDIKSMSCHRDALFIQLKSPPKKQVHIVMDCKQIVLAFTQFTGRNGPD